MLNFFRKGIVFIRKNPPIFYSLFLIVLIPAGLYFNTFFTIRSFEKNIDYVLQSKGIMIESILGGVVPYFFDNPEVLQKTVESMVKDSPELIGLRIIKPDGEKFKIIAAKDSREIGADISHPSLALSWNQELANVHLTSDKDQRFWEITAPFFGADGKKLGLIKIDLSLKNSDALILKSVRNSYLILFGIIVLTLFLIVQHTRLFGYLFLYRKLKEIDKMKDDFIRMAVHELQSPIAAIRGYIEVLKEETSALLNEAQTEYLSRISISGQRLADLIYDIVEVARIEQERMAFAPQIISAQKIVKEAVSELRLNAEKKGLELIFPEKEEKFFVFADPTRLRQVVVNLINNAIKYTKAGKVEVSTSVDENKKRYYIQVRDTGIGMSAEAQNRLFEKFYRIKTRETADISGTGLGLYISREISRKMKGDIMVESMEGVGSKFTLYLPLSKQ